MKTTFILLLASVFLICACEREAINTAMDAPAPQSSGNPGIPSYTKAEWDALLANTSDEAAFVEKTRLIAYTLTRWLGENAGAIGLTGGGTLNGVLPCDMGFGGDDGIFRLMAAATGSTETQVTEQMGRHLQGCVHDCTLPTTQAIATMQAVLGSLSHQGSTYDLRTTYSAGASPGGGQGGGNQPRIFISYGVGMPAQNPSNGTAQGIRALGFEYNLASGNLLAATKTLTAAQNLGAMLLLPRPVSGPGADREVNPCGITWNHAGSGGSGGSGGGGGNPGLDDDGAEKHIVDGPIVEADSFYNQCPANTRDALRIARFHLADRNEGGLFSGKSEVYLSASFWREGDPLSLVTNNKGKHLLVNVNGTACSINYGKHLTSVPSSDIGNNSVIITPSNGEDWEVIGSGFCRHGGYNRCKITLYEHDKLNNFTQALDWWHEDWTGWADTCKAHFCYMSYYNDTWFTNNHFDITPDDFGVQNNYRVYLVENGNSYEVWNFMPGNQYSWLELEAF